MLYYIYFLCTVYVFYFHPPLIWYMNEFNKIVFYAFDINIDVECVCVFDPGKSSPNPTLFSSSLCFMEGCCVSCNPRHHLLSNMALTEKDWHFLSL